MRTLVLTQIVPNPPDAGPKIKTHYALRTLAEGHEIELLTFARTPAEVAAAEGLKPWCARVTTVPLGRRRALEPWYLASGWARRRPFLVERDARRALTHAVRDRLAAGGIDVLHADQLSMAQYLPLARGTGVRTVFDAHNAVYDLIRDLARRQPTPAHRLAAEAEWRLLRRYEGALCRESDLTLAVSAHDRTLLEDAAGRPIPSRVIPIGVEVEEMPVEPIAPDATGLLSVATMLYPPNAEAIRWFRDAIWPLVRDAHPAATVEIVGPRPPRDLAEWGAREARVTVPGYVADLAAPYRRAALFIVPLRSGSGVRVKVLEAMARGLPVISTSIGVAGLDLRHGEHLLIADTPEAFAAGALQLLQSPARRAALARAARARVLELYDWRRCCRPLLDAYRDLARVPRTQAPSTSTIPVAQAR